MIDMERYKIGRAKDINERMKSYVTSYPEESEIKYSIKHPYYKEIEKLVHLTLKEHRMSNNREFFKCSLDLIKETIDEAREYTLEELSIRLNKGVGVILNGYKKEEVKEPINLSRENIIKVFKENDKELYTLFFNNVFFFKYFRYNICFICYECKIIFFIATFYIITF